MHVLQGVLAADDGTIAWEGGVGDIKADAVFVFGSGETFQSGAAHRRIQEQFPGAVKIGCSTSGEIAGTIVRDETTVVTAVQFDRTAVQASFVQLDNPPDSFRAGSSLVQELSDSSLKHVFVISDGLAVNGSELVRGLSSALPEGVAVTGGLAGDGERFEQTSVICNDRCSSGIIAALGFYGDALSIGYGSLGGWDPFGVERTVTRSSGNVLYELNEASALALYRQYLGSAAEELPASGLLFPLSMRVGDSDQWVVRTILGIDDEAQSITFAGDVPEGAQVRLMKANFDRLVDGAVSAAQTAAQPLAGMSAELAILISCVGRKMVLKQRVEEEVEGVRSVLGDGAVLSGFYSYGEISPFSSTAKCELHNQTMTITALSEQ